MTPEAAVSGWFAREHAAGLILPDGWYGRPHDNQHRLTAIAQDVQGTVSLTLDDRLQLVFTGLQTVASDGRDLVLGPFYQCRFLDGGPPVVYAKGVVRLVPMPGG